MAFLKLQAQEISFSYAPKTVTADGWGALRHAWQTLFPSIIIILCFLPVFLNLRKNKNKFKKLFFQLSQKLWHCYEASNKRTFVKKTQTFVRMV